MLQSNIIKYMLHSYPRHSHRSPYGVHRFYRMRSGAIRYRISTLPYPQIMMERPVSYPTPPPAQQSGFFRIILAILGIFAALFCLNGRRTGGGAKRRGGRAKRRVGGIGGNPSGGGVAVIGAGGGGALGGGGGVCGGSGGGGCGGGGGGGCGGGGGGGGCGGGGCGGG